MWGASAKLLYFAFVFGAGFVRRTSPRPADRPAQRHQNGGLIEAPIIDFGQRLAAHWIIRRFAVPPTATERIVIAIVALVLVLVTEFTLVLLASCFCVDPRQQFRIGEEGPRFRKTRQVFVGSSD